MDRSVRVCVANGEEIQCTEEIPKCAWSAQGLDFTTTMKILPLSNYDAILGMDWLIQHSPMTVDWENKELHIQHGTSTARLQGLSSRVSSCQSISSMQWQGFLRRGSIARVISLCVVSVTPEGKAMIPDTVQPLLSQFANVFAEPEGLPPRRACDHAIPLIPGARPVNARLYRHSPKLKDEIECQIVDTRFWHSKKRI